MGAIISYFFPVETTDYHYNHGRDFIRMYEPLPIDAMARLNRQSVKDKQKALTKRSEAQSPSPPVFEQTPFNNPSFFSF